LPDEEILLRLVALNAERAAEEKQGTIRRLRPEYQTKSKEERKAEQARLDIALPAPPAAKKKKDQTKAEVKAAWPSDLLEQTQAVRAAVINFQAIGTPITVNVVASSFVRAPRARIQEILDALATLGFIETQQQG
jgi:hypothetical protein